MRPQRGRSPVCHQVHRRDLSLRQDTAGLGRRDVDARSTAELGMSLLSLSCLVNVQGHTENDSLSSPNGLRSPSILKLSLVLVTGIKHFKFAVTTPKPALGIGESGKVGNNHRYRISISVGISFCFNESLFYKKERELRGEQTLFPRCPILRDEYPSSSSASVDSITIPWALF